jgi:hypothetical protein
LDRRLSRPQSRSGRSFEEKKSQPLPGLEALIIQPVAQHYTIELSRLLMSSRYHSVKAFEEFCPCSFEPITDGAVQQLVFQKASSMPWVT